MKCKKYEEKIVLYLYGELDDREKAEVENHVKECPACLEDLEYTKKVFKLVDDNKEIAPEANWEKCWREIGAGVQVEPRKQKKFLFAPRWVYAAAALFLVFVLGALIGRYWFFPSQESPLEPGISQGSINLALNEYIESIKPILIEYANYTVSEEGGETILIDEKVVRGLLIQNLLLKDLIVKSDPSLIPFLEDLDIILKELSNMRSGDELTPSMIKELIHEREILFKIEILQTM
ncbi:MAG: zf-HC2 domain-containing protein [Candidatus Aminicenantes bacterium]|nr:MAG: zf-HC2 domain-containing protein [Candidatus Aminicenantes bacterium]